MKRNALVLAIAATVGLAACVAPPPPRREVVYVTTRQAPPPPRVEAVPPPPNPGFHWVGGHWKWEGGGYVWEPGHYVEPRPREVWVQAFWQERGNGEWVYHPGHWQPQ